MDTEKLDKNFENGNFDIGQGETCLILGENSVGKTSACYYYMQILPDEKFGVYINWSKTERGLTDVKTFLYRYIMMSYSGCDLDISAWRSVWDWMNVHSDSVVFIIDNLTFTSDFEVDTVLDVQNAKPENILYHLICKERNLFKNSQVLCTSNSEHVKTVLNATKTLEIIGFDESRVKQMMRSNFENFDEDERLPESIMYFCVNPGYCKHILQILKSGHHVDVDSYSSLLVNVLHVSMEQYSEKEKNDKWKCLADNINQHQTIHLTYRPTSVNSAGNPPSLSETESETASVVSDFRSVIEFNRQRNLDEKSCKKLQEDINRALYYSYFCPHKPFNIKTLIKEEGRVWRIAAGLLKEDHMQQLKTLFEIADKTQDVAIKNRRALRSCISKHMEKKMGMIFSCHEDTLRWLDAFVELNDESLMKATKQSVKINNSMTESAVEQAADFFGKLPKKFLPYLEVSFSKDLSKQRRVTMDTGIGKNLHAKLVSAFEDNH